MTNREALEAAIAHHEANAEAGIPSQAKLGMSHCALCRPRRIGLRVNCDDCPVALFTGLPGCDGTPYGNVAHTHNSWETAVGDYSEEEDMAALLREEFRAAEGKEIAFLRRVLRETPEDILRVTPEPETP